MYRVFSLFLFFLQRRRNPGWFCIILVSHALGVFLNAADDGISSVSLCRDGLIIIDPLFPGRRYFYRNNVCYIIFCQFSVFQSKGLLKDHRIHITGRRIASKAEICQAVDNIFPFISLYSLKHMGMMAQDQICPMIYG